jgi:hypothetical protein
VKKTCTACSHPERKALDAALASGASRRALGRRFALSPSALARHATHMAAPERTSKPGGLNGSSAKRKLAVVGRGAGAGASGGNGAHPPSSAKGLAGRLSAHIEASMTALDQDETLQPVDRARALASLGGALVRVGRVEAVRTLSEAELVRTPAFVKLARELVDILVAFPDAHLAVIARLRLAEEQEASERRQST